MVQTALDERLPLRGLRLQAPLLQKRQQFAHPLLDLSVAELLEGDVKRCFTERFKGDVVVGGAEGGLDHSLLKGGRWRDNTAGCEDGARRTFAGKGGFSRVSRPIVQ